ncbi:MAG: hypothetical protein HC821_00240 [Lewinella sp.]|nr:hypothetical protein [Lewinella sp.]
MGIANGQNAGRNGRLMRMGLGLQWTAEALLPRLSSGAALDWWGNASALVAWLEPYYGLQHLATDYTHLREEQYRQLCGRYLIEHPYCFFRASFQADPRATAADLLGRRDELLSAGYSFEQAVAKLPARLGAIVGMEQLLLDPAQQLLLLPGLADRLRGLLAALRGKRRHPKLDLYYFEPWPGWPPGLRRLLKALSSVGDEIRPWPEVQLPEDPKTDLALWQWQSVNGRSEGKAHRLQAQGDGSLLLLRAERETDLAAYLAKLGRLNPEWQPGLLLPSRNQTLNDALTMEGLPDLGVPVASLGRPSLQVLKLITAFMGAH